jgi:zinc transporter 2
MIWVLTAVLLYEAVMRATQWFEGKAEEVDGRLMFFISVIGIGVNFALERVLGDSHAHFHSHAHHTHSHGAEEHHMAHDRSPT